MNATAILIGCTLLAGCGVADTRPLSEQVRVVDDFDKFLLKTECNDDGSVSLPLTIENSSKVPVAIKLQSTSCGCLKVVFDSNVIQPGESISAIALQRGPIPVGPSQPQFLFEISHSNDTDARRLSHTSSFTVLDLLEFNPSYLFYEFAGDENEGASQFRVIARTRGKAVTGAPVLSMLPSEIELVSCGDARIVPGPNDIVETHWDANFRVVSSEAVEQGLVGQFAVEVGNQSRAITYKIVRSIGIQVSPTVLRFSEVQFGQVNKRRIALRARDSVPFEVVSCSAASSEFEAQPLTDGSAMIHLIEVRCNSSDPQTELHDILSVVTTHNCGAELQIGLEALATK